MSHSHIIKPIVIFIVLAGLLSAPLVGLARAAEAPTPLAGPIIDSPAQEPGPTDGGNDIDRCANCHGEIVDDWQTTPHHDAFELENFQEAWDEVDQDPQCLDCHTTGFSPATETYHTEGISCEACHGVVPEEHPAQPVELANAKESCSDCHTVTHAEFRASLHEAADLECTSCHYAHTNGLRLGDQVSQCLNCHGHQLDDFAHESHVEAGLVCRNCHGYVAPGSFEQRPDGQTPTGHDFRINVTACLDCHDDIELSPVNGEVELPDDEGFESGADADDGTFSRGDTEEAILLGQRAELRINELQAQVDTLQHEERNQVVMSIVLGAAGGLFLGGIGVIICRRGMLNGNNTMEDEDDEGTDTDEL